MAALTFLFTDIEGSTRLWDLHPQAMKKALSDHDEVIRKIVDAHGGKVFKHTGDGALAVFGAAADGLVSAADLARRLADQVHPDVGALKVRIAVHTGDAEERDDDYFGPALNRTSRLLSVANGGQVLVSLITERMAGGVVGEGISFRDLGEHRLRDLARSERIFQMDVAGVPTDFPPLRTPDMVPNNLPTLATSFVGRDQELAEVEKLIRGARVLTLTGVGGAGKTRLAIQAAVELVDEFPGGTWLIELGAITDPDYIDATAADALGVAQPPGRSVRESIVEHLAGRQALLIVDNCEHMISGAAEFVADLVAGAPETKVVATSRELLGVSGEVAYGMPSLAMPRRGETPDLAELIRYDAVRLFLERAQAGQPNFHITEAMAPSVAEICRRLDGMPLALELAAARLRTFSPKQIAENLDQRFRLLTGGSRTALPRQQTLSAAIDWSYRLLEEPERRLFERLSVFQGGFTLEAVEDICTDDELDVLSVLELLPSLVDKSLVAVDSEGEDSRYRLLETLRQFARDRLDESGAADAFRLRHARWFRDLSVEAGKNIRGPQEQEWWQRIDTELDNLRQAMTWAIEGGEPALALEIAGGFWRFWWFKARWSEGVSWLERAVGAAGEDAPALVRAQGLLGLGTLLISTERHLESVPMLEEAGELYRRLDEEGADTALLMHGYSAALINLGVEMEGLNEFDRAAELNEQALEVSRRIGDPAGLAVSLGNLAESAGRTGDVEGARERFRNAIAASRALESAQRLCEQYWQVGFFELSAGEPGRAREAFQQSLVQVENGGLDDYLPLSRAYLAFCEAEAGDDTGLDRYVEHVQRSFANPHVRVFGAVRAINVVLRAVVDARRGDLEGAARLLGAIEAEEEEGNSPWWVLSGLRDRVAAEIGDGLDTDVAARARDEGRQLDLDARVDLITAD
ncbi:MAG: adenylate/guanylate cyclase domain-containing protein [Acidimicrobiia bacterium]